MLYIVEMPIIGILPVDSVANHYRLNTYALYIAYSMPENYLQCMFINVRSVFDF